MSDRQTLVAMFERAGIEFVNGPSEDIKDNELVLDSVRCGEAGVIFTFLADNDSLLSAVGYGG